MGSVAAASIAGRERRVIDGAQFEEARDRRDRAAGVIAVSWFQYPLLVTFADITELASVALVDPADRAASFGPGARLKSVTLEVRGEAVTEGHLGEVLPQTFFQRWARDPHDAFGQGRGPEYANSLQ